MTSLLCAAKAADLRHPGPGASQKVEAASHSDDPRCQRGRRSEKPKGGGEGV